jgi:tungstate transport system substrate-binding protein
MLILLALILGHMNYKKLLFVLTVTFVVLAGIAFSGCTTPVPPAATPTPTPAPAQEDLLIATTTSLYDTGLLDYLGEIFGPEYNANLRVTSKGTGQAIELGRGGDVDVLMVHDRVREDAFLADGSGVDRRVFAYNYFIIVGPPSDPAGIKDMSPTDAFTTLYEKGQTDPSVVFVSRGDDSGTHAREKLIWKQAGYDYEQVRASGAWYIEAGTGMGTTLNLADEKDAYTLSDIGTFLAYKTDLDLVPLVTQGDDLLNVYSAMIINPAKYPDTKVELSKEWINWLISPETQQEIGNFGVAEYGQPLFYPARDNWELLGVSQTETQDPIP